MEAPQIKVDLDKNWKKVHVMFQPEFNTQVKSLFSNIEKSLNKHMSRLDYDKGTAEVPAKVVHDALQEGFTNHHKRNIKKDVTKSPKYKWDR